MRIVIPVVLLGVLFPTSSPAPIFSVCSKVSELLAESEAVAVVEILERPTGMTMDPHGAYRVRVIQTFKGSLPQGEAVLRLRNLSDVRWGGTDYRVGRRYLVFLDTMNRREEPFASVNCLPNHFEISATDPSLFKREDLAQTVRDLAAHHAGCQKARSDAVAKEMAYFAGEATVSFDRKPTELRNCPPANCVESEGAQLVGCDILPPIGGR